MWIERDKDGWVMLSARKPYLLADSQSWYDESVIWCGYDDELFPEVTFENSPKELVIKD